MSPIECLFAPDHPAAQGHFPGNPIIPGAVLLSETLRLIESELGRSLLPFEIRTAKFFLPTRPGDRVVIEFTGSAPGEIRFECTVRGSKVLDGQLRCSVAA
jgi:3-hydroxymyristoyl/3-hydroxydecanoyl-(acyl carrier protein) dehydratase